MMKAKHILLLGALALGTAAGTAPADHASHHPAGAPEASIPFVGSGGIRDFQPDGSEAVWLQDRNRRWYHATLLGACLDLPYAQAIGADVRGVGALDRFGTLIVRGQRCPIQSLVRSGPPPRKQKAARRG